MPIRAGLCLIRVWVLLLDSTFRGVSGWGRAQDCQKAVEVIRACRYKLRISEWTVY